MTNILRTILAINPKAEVTISSEDVKQIIWHNDTKPIAEADILAKQKELKDAELEKANHKKSALNKLKSLGLTDDEIETLRL